MSYTPEQREELFTNIFSSIENGSSLRKALTEVKISSSTFYEWLEEQDEHGNQTQWSKDKSKQYARACEERAEALLDEIIDIVDSSEGDLYVDDNGDTKIDGNTVQRARLQHDARKWLVSKLNPKKYGDRVQVAGDPESPLNVSLGFASERQEEEFNEFLKKKYKFKE